jgi:hypothetical protein
MLVDVAQAFTRETNGSICVVYNPARSPSHGINLPDFQGQYTSMPCDGPSVLLGGFLLLFLTRLERLERTDPIWTERSDGTIGTAGTESVFGKHQGSHIPRGLKKGIKKHSHRNVTAEKFLQGLQQQAS